MFKIKSRIYISKTYIHKSNGIHTQIRLSSLSSVFTQKIHPVLCLFILHEHLVPSLVFFVLFLLLFLHHHIIICMSLSILEQMFSLLFSLSLFKCKGLTLSPILSVNKGCCWPLFSLSLAINILSACFHCSIKTFVC